MERSKIQRNGGRLRQIIVLFRFRIENKGNGTIDRAVSVHCHGNQNIQSLYRDPLLSNDGTRTTILQKKKIKTKCMHV